MAQLYPEIEPHDTGMLDVGDGNRVYREANGGMRTWSRTSRPIGSSGGHCTFTCGVHSDAMETLARPTVGERYAAATQTVVRRLPFGLSRVVAPTFLGFAVINSFTFGVDLLLLWTLHTPLRWPLPWAITLAYATAFGLAYLLNRVLNFRSHAPVGPQLGVYAAVVVVNYLVCVLGAGTGFASLGLDFRMARLLGGVCEAAFMYVAMRRLVFRDTSAAVHPRRAPSRK